ncbi:protease modulator HflC [Sorangium sp. So ce315]|uniref:protease modulator HflC n=1 Tax=Sorangium sp. So ce315 TaxID=3133299 RepID=UPI003F5E5659
MSSKVAGIGAFIALILITVYSAAFTVGQAEQACIIQFGQFKGEAITKPGLYWKWPFVQEVRRLDRRLLTWDGSVEQIPTLGREFILMDAAAHYRIANPRLFLESLRDERGARSRIDDILNAIVRDKISGAKLEEIIRSSDWHIHSDALEDGIVTERDASMELAPRRGRQELEREILEAAQAYMPNYGIELQDVHIRRVHYIESVRQQVESRIIAERQSIAERFRSEGRGRSEEILGEMQKELQAVRSEAHRKAEEIRGAADAQVTQIYGQAYGQNAEFYGFLKTLEAYRGTVGPNTSLMFSANSDFYRYLESVRER